MSDTYNPPDSRLQRALITFTRIGRWGTCVECPRSDGVFPEFCKNTERYDHQLSGKDLAQQIIAWENRKLTTN